MHVHMEVHLCVRVRVRVRVQVMYEMKAAGFVPDSDTYDALLLGCAKHGEPVARLQAEAVGPCSP